MQTALEKSWIKGLLFDKDGTLLDFQATWGHWSVELIRALAAGNAEHEGLLASELGVDMQSSRVLPGSIIVAGTPDDIGAAVEASNIFPISSDDISRRVLASAESVQPVAVNGLAKTLDDLRRRGFFLGVATNDAEHIARANLVQLGIEQHFGYVAGFDSGYGAKPGPGMCLGFAAYAGFDAQQIAMIGDSRHDLDAGRAAGMVTIAVETGMAQRQDLAAFADVVLTDISQIAAWLDCG